MTDFRENGRGIAAMLVASAGFIANDTLVKLAGEAMPLGQIIFVRGVFACILMGGLAWYVGALAQPRRLLHRAVRLRASAETIATGFYLAALSQMPIANATAILQALPLLVTAGSAIFMAARVGWRRWSAVLVGFCGVLLIVRPGFEGFSIWSLSALAGVIFMAVRDLATRVMPREVHTFAAALASLLLSTLILGPLLAPFETWIWPQAWQFAYLAAAAGFLAIGYSTIIISMRSGEIAVVAPFRYSIVIWAIALGFVVWGDVPDALTLAGIAILMATGVYTFLRERKVARTVQSPLSASQP